MSSASAGNRDVHVSAPIVDDFHPSRTTFRSRAKRAVSRPECAEVRRIAGVDWVIVVRLAAIEDLVDFRGRSAAAIRKIAAGHK